MNLIKLIIVISSITFLTTRSNCFKSISTQDSSLNYKNANKDTILIEIKDSNDLENSFYLSFIYVNDSILSEVYRVKVVDYNVEADYSFYFTNDSLSYSCYTIYHLTTGFKQSLLLNKKDKRIYLTDNYDPKAIGDSIVRNSVSFPKMQLKIHSEDQGKQSVYSVKMRNL